ncbi:hypothetical protein D9619_009823 [Psilocybe cf. subviscida]|uniref:Uncharacterized protein n=1 Tax=Psilocybe cf. subviscida TaxID=2480587 RepID=A0A8H5F683_9AGAR|nr:hypothetical protein D9619_009823 [Psilocybe cf. subviscida]
MLTGRLTTLSSPASIIAALNKYATQLIVTQGQPRKLASGSRDGFAPEKSQIFRLDASKLDTAVYSCISKDHQPLGLYHVQRLFSSFQLRAQVPAASYLATIDIHTIHSPSPPTATPARLKLKHYVPAVPLSPQPKSALITVATSGTGLHLRPSP